VLLLRQEVVPDAPFTATIDMPAPQAVEIPLRNPIGILPGATRPEEFVLVSAHYDHLGIGTPVNGDSIYNGADDDASGTTAVVVLAEALAKSGPRPARSIAFICFSGEEKGLRGSRAFAEDPPIALENVVANINIEMIGRPRADDRMAAWITGADLSDFAEIAGPALMRAEVRLVGFEMADRLFDRSDNASLARKGVVAHSISAGTPHGDYHQPSDEVDKIDLQHMTAVIAGLAEVVLEFAQRDERPAYNERGKARLQGGRRP
jgi:Zn-dependent M28 family amino/carboxypeptidase